MSKKKIILGDDAFDALALDSPDEPEPTSDASRAEDEFECEDCPASYKTQGWLTRHRRDKHGDEQTDTAKKEKPKPKKPKKSKAAANEVDYAAGVDATVDAVLADAKVAQEGPPEVHLQSSQYRPLVELAAMYDRLRDPEDGRKPLFGTRRMATMAVQAWLDANEDQLRKVASADQQVSEDDLDLLTVGTVADDNDPDRAGKVKLHEPVGGRLRVLTKAATHLRGDGGRQLISMDAIANEAVRGWLDANEQRLREKGASLGSSA